MSMDIFWLCLLGVSLLGAIMSGVPVMLAIAGAPMLIAFVAAVFGQFDLSFFAAYPQRVFGVMNNSLLVAIPLFVLMGIILEKSRQAEKLLLNITQLFGQTRSTLALAVIFVSTLIAASTGIIGATIVMLGVISLPVMLKHGISPRLSSGLICASGTLGQIIPPSIVLILLGDQISNAYLEAQQSVGNFAPEPVSIGDLFAGAIFPGLILVALYGLYSVAVLTWGKPSGQHASQNSQSSQPLQSTSRGASDRSALLDVPTTSVVRLVLEIIPPTLLIMAVLGSILLGIATPTEAASIGVAGTLLIAAASLEAKPGYLGEVTILTVLLFAGLVVMQRSGLLQLSLVSGVWSVSPGAMVGVVLSIAAFAGLGYAVLALARAGLLKASLTGTVVISAMIFGIIIAASMLSLVFRGFHGDELVHALLTSLPGGAWGMLVLTMVVIFLLGFVLEFVEIVFIVIPIVGPILLQADFHPVWFAILIALNIQTSFLTPPFGFALFYYRSVAPRSISTVEIYKSVIPFVLLQILTIGIVVAFPSLATWLPDLLFR